MIAIPYSPKSPASSSPRDDRRMKVRNNLSTMMHNHEKSPLSPVGEDSTGLLPKKTLMDPSVMKKMFLSSSEHSPGRISAKNSTSFQWLTPQPKSRRNMLTRSLSARLEQTGGRKKSKFQFRLNEMTPAVESHDDESNSSSGDEFAEETVPSEVVAEASPSQLKRTPSRRKMFVKSFSERVIGKSKLPLFSPSTAEDEDDEDTSTETTEEDDSVEAAAAKLQNQQLQRPTMQKQPSIGRRMWDRVKAASRRKLVIKNVTFDLSTSKVNVIKPFFKFEKECENEDEDPVYLTNKDLWWTKEELNETRREAKRSTYSREDPEVRLYLQAFQSAYEQVACEAKLSSNYKQALVRGLSRGYRGLETYSSWNNRRRTETQDTVLSVIHFYRSTAQAMKLLYPTQSGEPSDPVNTMNIAGLQTPHRKTSRGLSGSFHSPRKPARLERDSYESTAKLLRAHSMSMTVSHRQWAQAVGQAEKFAANINP